MRFLLLSLLLLFFKPGYGQLNLVPNPSFEIFDTCPDNLGQIQRATGWYNCGEMISTPDFYNSCDTGIVTGWKGVHQIAHSGNGFAAVFTYFQSNLYREFIGIQLSQPLSIGTKYFLSFYAVTGEAWNLSCPTNNQGILLSTMPYSTSNPVTCNNFAHLKSDSIIADTINWTLISGSIIADSAYDYLMLGNFYTNSNTNILQWSPQAFEGYYGLDDICLSTDSTACNNLTFLNLIHKEKSKIFPNPTSNIISISDLENDNYVFQLFDMLGEEIFTGSCNNCTSYNVNLENLSQGYYVLIYTGIQNPISVHNKIYKF